MEENNKNNEIDYDNITLKEYINLRFGKFKNFKFPKASALAKKLGFTKKFCIFLAFVLTFTSGCCLSLLAYKYFIPTTSSKLDQINALVRKYYTGEIDNTTLENALADAYMENIDDNYAFYKDADTGELVEQSLEGTTNGIGVTVTNSTDNKSLVVFRVNENSPAHKVGIKKGDKITAIDGKTVEDMGYKESLLSIKRKIGEKAKITILRGEETLNFTVVYENFVRQSVYYEIVENYGYLTLTDFNKNTVPQFLKAYEYLNEKKVKGLIFDLRENGGGTVNSVCEILDVLVGECNLMTVVYKDGKQTVSDNAKSDANKCDLPMAVLVDEGTASAAEIFAGNLRDMAKAPLIGKNTYGKGVVQRTYFFDDGSCIRFTVGEFVTASGKSFNGTGLAPDYEISAAEEQAAYETGGSDPYLSKAIETLNKGFSKEQ